MTIIVMITIHFPAADRWQLFGHCCRIQEEQKLPALRAASAESWPDREQSCRLKRLAGCLGESLQLCNSRADFAGSAVAQRTHKRKKRRWNRRMKSRGQSKAKVSR